MAAEDARRTQTFVVRMEVVFGRPINGGLFNALKKLTDAEHKLLEQYVGEVAASFRNAPK
jgi:hypothetical protein